MKINKLILSIFFIFFFGVVTVLAQDVANTTVVPKVTTADKIACVRAAIATRENAIQSAVSDHQKAVQGAYATRLNELTGAYSNSNVKAVQAGVKVSWADFNKTIKSASVKWKASRTEIWAAYRAAAKACKAPAGVSDSSNSGSEMSGQ